MEKSRRKFKNPIFASLISFWSQFNRRWKGVSFTWNKFILAANFQRSSNPLEFLPFRLTTFEIWLDLIGAAAAATIPVNNNMDYFICIEKIEYVYVLLIFPLSSISMSAILAMRFVRSLSVSLLFFFFITRFIQIQKWNSLFGTAHPFTLTAYFCFSFVSIKMEMTHKFMNFGRHCFRFSKYAIRTMSNMMEITFHRWKPFHCNLLLNYKNERRKKQKKNDSYTYRVLVVHNEGLEVLQFFFYFLIISLNI